MPPLLITRAAAEAAVLAEKLGPPAIVAPCLVYEDVPVTRPSLPGADLLVTSPRAVPPLARLGLDPSWRVLALAPATAAALGAAGLPVHHAQPGGAAALAAAAGPGPLLYATSDLGGDEVLRVRPDAIRWVLYRTVCPDALPPAALAALAGPFDVLFTSPSAVRNFDQLAPGALARARRILCHGATTRAAVRTMGHDAVHFSLP
jgi:uroporphyrinogen-III synthase